MRYDESLEEIIDMARHMVYDHRNGTKFCTGELPVAHYMIPCVESLLRIRPCMVIMSEHILCVINDYCMLWMHLVVKYSCANLVI